jgi:putative phosphonate metabolism protein
MGQGSFAKNLRGTIVTRYAIYYAPAASDPLWTFGSSALGYDAASRARVDFPDHPALRTAPLEAWTAEPRKYGFHATLKPPFALAPGADEAALAAAAREFAATQASFDAGPLRVSAIGAFVALKPAGPAPGLSRLADSCVEAFDRFRAPASAAERARRLQSPLTPSQIENLDRWGYPYVFADFRFHMTLSGPLHEDDRTLFAAAMGDLYVPFARPLVVDGIALFKQAEPSGAFAVLERFAFAKAA